MDADQQDWRVSFISGSAHYRRKIKPEGEAGGKRGGNRRKNKSKTVPLRRTFIATVKREIQLAWSGLDLTIVMPVARART